MQNKKLYIGLALFVVIGSGIALAVMGNNSTVPSDTAVKGSTAVPSSKVAAASIEDGTYYASVISVSRNPEDTTASFEHVMFFQGSEAKDAALEDVDCEEIIENCVPSLKNGYYVRKSGAPVFSAPILKAATIALAGSATASHADLENQVGGLSYIPVYEVVIKEGAVASVTEVTKP